MSTVTTNDRLDCGRYSSPTGYQRIYEAPGITGVTWPVDRAFVMRWACRITEATEKTEDTEKLPTYQWTQKKQCFSGSNERDDRLDDAT
jgi:hypothetical protein